MTECAQRKREEVGGSGRSKRPLRRTRERSTCPTVRFTLISGDALGTRFTIARRYLVAVGTFDEPCRIPVKGRAKSR